MVWTYPPYVIPLILNAILSAGLAYAAWRRRPAAGAALSALAMLAVCEWSVAYTLQILSPSLSAKLLWANVRYIGVVTVPTAWFLFALDYVGRQRWLTRRNLALLAVEPTLVLLAVWSNPRHGLIWRVVRLGFVDNHAVMLTQHGPGFWLHAAYTYAIFLIGAVLVLRTLFRLPAVYRQQGWVLLGGILAPIVANVLSILRLNPFPYLDLTPFAFAITGLSVMGALFRVHFLDIVPVARDTVIESMSDGMLVLDAQNRIVDINPAAEAMLNLSAAQVIGQPAREALAPYADVASRFRDTFRAQAEIIAGESENQRCFDLRISPLYDRHGHRTGRLVVLRDITDRKKVEVALRRARDAAETANRAKSTFLANISHELRTPLTIIIGYSEILQEDARNLGVEEMCPPLELIHEAGEHLHSVISDLLDISRLETGQMPLYLESFPLNQLLDSVANSVRPLMAQNDNHFHVAYPPQLGLMYADIKKVRQILLNLLSNAAKFTHGGEVTFKVRREPAAEGDAAPGDYFVFTVADTGIGIPTEQIERLFQPFTQADESFTRKYGGTGLGLAISKRFCQLMGGRIGVESTPQQGSVFTVHLPVRVQNHRPPE